MELNNCWKTIRYLQKNLPLLYRYNRLTGKNKVKRIIVSVVALIATIAIDRVGMKFYIVLETRPLFCVTCYKNLISLDNR